MKVKFLPKKSIDVEICDIYEDRDAVIIQHTDTFVDNCAYNVEALGFKFNLKPCAFHWPYTGIQNELTDVNETGVVKFGVYVPTDKYRGETTSGNLPDYGTEIITAAGAEYYGKAVGSPKIAGYPNQGQELFDYTGGVKGYDVINGAAGSEGNMDFIREMNFVDEWYKSKFGRLPSSGSDRQGKIGSLEVYLPYYLAIRKTTTGGVSDYENIERLDFIHRNITSRWENGFINSTIPAANTALETAINDAFANKGMMVDFVHWHRAAQYNGIYLLHDLYELIKNTIAGRNAWSTGHSEAVEYYWFKKMTKRVRGSIINGKLHLIADFDDEYINDEISGIPKQLLYDRIKQPLSVKIDLTGTVLAGKNLKGAEIISLGSNQFIVDIPFTPTDNGFKEVVLSESTVGQYKNFSLPNIVSNVGGVITTDVDTKAVIFGGDFNTTMTVKKRSLTFGKTHDFSGLTGKIGIITKHGSTALE